MELFLFLHLSEDFQLFGSYLHVLFDDANFMSASGLLNASFGLSIDLLLLQIELVLQVELHLQVEDSGDFPYSGVVEEGFELGALSTFEEARDCLGSRPFLTLGKCFHG